MKITTYQSQSAEDGCTWLAHMQIERTISMSFFGNTEAQALDKANRWWEAEKTRQLALVANIRIEQPTNEAPVVGSGRGQGFAGKVWMLNRATGERARVMPNEVAAYTANGYVPGGPRSK